MLLAAITHYIGKYAHHRWHCRDYLGNNIDPTGASAISFTVKAADTDADGSILFEKTLADDVAIVEVDDVYYIDVEIDKDGDDTSELTEGDKIFDLQVVTSSGECIVIEKDTFTLDYPVKRAAPA